MLLASAFVSACATVAPPDYTNFRQARPRSVLVLPPLNRGLDMRGTYGYLSTVTRPLAEMGYYVFPVAMVDQFLKENGLPTPGEMHQAPLNKFAEIFGADSVLYITLDAYGTKYNLLSSNTTVAATARLLDTRTGLLLWQGQGMAFQGSGNSGGGILGALVQAAVTQIVNSSADTAHAISGNANLCLFAGPRSFGSSVQCSGGPTLLLGPYRPESDAQYAPVVTKAPN
jgi:hypothetical protein